MAAHVLIVEDDAMVLRTLADVFRLRQFEVSTATSAAEAIAALAERSFDVVVTDMRMETPAAGYDVIAAAKANPSTPLTIILSAFPIPTPDWKQAGADAMFIKGGGVGRILDEIAEMLAKRQSHRGKPAARVEDGERGKRSG